MKTNDSPVPETDPTDFPETSSGETDTTPNPNEHPYVLGERVDEAGGTANRRTFKEAKGLEGEDRERSCRLHENHGTSLKEAA